jgi:ATP-dependent DNA ligase
MLLGRLTGQSGFPLMARYAPVRSAGTTSRPPKWIKPQLTRLVDEAPAGDGWLHEIKFDDYRMHARIEGGQAKLLTRTGLDCAKSYCTCNALGDRSFRRSRPGSAMAC